MKEPLPLSPAPELVFGLVAPIGTDLELLTEVLSQSLREMNYLATEFRLTRLMREVPTGLPLVEKPYIRSFKDRIAYANEVRRHLGDEALAALAISAIRSFRGEERDRKAVAQGPSTLTGDVLSGDERDEEAPLPNQAYIIRQFKRPEEISLLRSVDGRQFILVSAYAPQEERRRRIEERERQSRGGLISELEAQELAHELVLQDANETLERHGQNVRDAFPLGDVFIDVTTRPRCEENDPALHSFTLRE